MLVCSDFIILGMRPIQIVMFFSANLLFRIEKDAELLAYWWLESQIWNFIFLSTLESLKWLMKFASQLECYLKGTIDRFIFKNINCDQFHCSINIRFNLPSTYNFLFISTSQYIVNYDKTICYIIQFYEYIWGVQ